MRCVAINGDGLVADIAPQPVGIAECVYVLASPAEVGSPWVLSLGDAVSISTAIALVWAMGWAFRQLHRVVSDPEHFIEDDSK